MQPNHTIDDVIALYRRCADTLNQRGYPALAAVWEAEANKIEAVCNRREVAKAA